MNDFNKILDSILAKDKDISKKELLSKLLDQYTKSIINNENYHTEFEYTLGGNHKEKKLVIYYLEAWKKSDRSDKPKVIYLNNEQKMYMTRVLTAMTFEDNGKIFEAETFKFDV
jgi:hypothetical protein